MKRAAPKRTAAEASSTSNVPSDLATMNSSSSVPPPLGFYNSFESSPVKKQKLQGQKDPIIFTGPKKRPDTCIVVFDQEFHVQSEALQLHTVFFQRFMGPANALAPRKPTTGAWKYEWFTKVEDPASWVLSSAPEDRDSDTSNYVNHEVQVKAFENLLSALFGRQAKLFDAADLIALTDLADYYLCLPIVSNACYETLFDNFNFNSSITKNSSTLLSYACKLRHKILFRECLIHTVGNFSIELSQEHISNPNLYNTMVAIRRKAESTLYSVGKEILETQLNPILYGEGKKANRSDIKDWVFSMTHGCYSKTTDGKTRIMLPMYYRKLWLNDHPSETVQASFKRVLDPIMKNNLRMDSSGLGTGEGKFRNHFLFIHIEECELPWESSQTDF